MFEFFFCVISGLIFIMFIYMTYLVKDTKSQLQFIQMDVDRLDRFRERYLNGFYENLEKLIRTGKMVDTYKNVQQSPKVTIPLDDLKNVSFYEED